MTIRINAQMVRTNAKMVSINAMMIRIIAILSLLLLPLYSMPAQEKPQSPVTLSVEDAIAIGLKNNFNIRIARNEAELASNSTTFGTANFLPTLDLTGGISMGDSRQETNSPFSFGDSQTSGGDAKLSLNWTLFDGFRMFVDNTRYLELEKLGEYRSRQIIESTVVNILRSYFDLVQQEELREVAENTMRTSLTRLEKEEVRKEIGGASSTDYLNAKVSYNNDRTMVLNQELKVAIAGQDLNMLLGRSSDTPVAVTSTFDIPTLENGLDELLERAYIRNSALLTAQQNSIVAEKNVDLATSVFWPRLGLFANYGLADRTVSSSSPRFTEDISTQSKDGMVGLSLSFNLFNGLRDNTKRQNAQIEAMNAQLVLEDGKIRLAGLVREKHLTFEQRVQIVALEQQNVQAAEQNLELERDRYEMGSSGSLEFRDAQVKLARAQTTLIVARYQARITWLEIQQLIGAINLN